MLSSLSSTHKSLVTRPPLPDRLPCRNDLGRFVVGACRASLRSSPIAQWMIFSVTECEMAHIRMSYFGRLVAKRCCASATACPGLDDFEDRAKVGGCGLHEVTRAIARAFTWRDQRRS